LNCRLASVIMKPILLIIGLSIIFSCGQKSAQVDVSNLSISTEVLKITDEDTVNTDKSTPVGQNCAYKNDVSDVGKGLIIAPARFELFHDSLLTNKYLTVDVYNDFELGDPNFCPMYYKPDYGIMHFVCIEETTNSYKVLTGVSEYKFLPKTNDYKFRNWEEYILESYGIRRGIEPAWKQPIRVKPLESSKEIEIPEGLENLCPLELEGDWVKVKYDCFYNSESNEYEGEPCYEYIDKCDDSAVGWIKWREKNVILIDIFLLP
jgi:hypothetical protein